MLDKIKQLLSPMAPVLGGMLGGPLGAAAGTALKQLLCGNQQASDEQLAAALETASPDQLVKIKQMDNQFKLDMEQLAVARNKDELQAEMAQTEQINKTMQVEYDTNDRYKSYWRPTFGYAVAITWVLQTIGITLGIFYASVYHPQEAGTIFNGIAAIAGSLATQWLIALSVLGINISARSKDKANALGEPQTGLIQALAHRIGAK
jgi:hypothetical protein